MEKKKKISIADLLPKPREVEISEGVVLEVHGVTLEQMVQLLWAYREAFLGMYAAGQTTKINYASLVVAAPDLVASVIAMGTSTEGQEADIKRLPPTSQIVAVTQIWEISVPDPKKLIASLLTVMEGLKKVSTQPQIKEALSRAAPKEKELLNKPSSASVTT